MEYTCDRYTGAMSHRYFIVAIFLPNFFEGGGESGKARPCRMGAGIFQRNKLLSIMQSLINSRPPRKEVRKSLRAEMEATVAATLGERRWVTRGN